MKQPWTITLTIESETEERAALIATTALLMASGDKVLDVCDRVLLDRIRNHPRIRGLGPAKTRIVHEVLDEMEAGL